MWFLADVIGLFSVNVGSFSLNLVPDARIFSTNVVPKNGCNRVLRFMLSGRYRYKSFISISDRNSFSPRIACAHALRIKVNTDKFRFPTSPKNDANSRPTVGLMLSSILQSAAPPSGLFRFVFSHFSSFPLQPRARGEREEKLLYP